MSRSATVVGAIALPEQVTLVITCDFVANIPPDCATLPMRSTKT